MALDLTGIHNVNEFYTDHYLATYFEQFMRDAVSAWRNQKAGSNDKAPWQALRDASKDYYRLFDRSARADGLLQPEEAEAMVSLYLSSLGYEDGEPEEITLPDGTTVPLFREYTDGKGNPRVWVIAALPMEDQDLLSASPLDLSDGQDATPCPLSCEEALNALLATVPKPARFVILASPSELVLVDRNRWADKRYLSFDMEEIYRRRVESTLQATATLLARSSLCPASGELLIDRLDSEASKNAADVSDKLKYALRECVELLGNEVIYDWEHNKGRMLDDDPIDAGELTIQCLRYLYRLLFLLFMEARPDLGFSPVKSEAYQKSYSLLSIQDIAEGHWDDIDAAVDDTYYIDQTLDLVCELVYDGYPRGEEDYQRLQKAQATRDVFLVPPLKAHIFDRDRTPLVDGARLRDSVMLKIINRLSYTHPTKGRSERVSYGTLGINQLGSVYEALLSYRGFIATERLYEVKRAKDKFDPLDVGYFVPEGELGLYGEEERVHYETGPLKGQLRTYEKGQFIYRLAGREREQSASFYTPESLTKCLVKYALKELLKGKTADQILHLTICEPAMGSADFLNETINQLAEAYLARRQEELGKTIPHDQRQLELQRTKMYIADRNVYGIDLNPIAVELGEVSLWLNTISQDGHVPWFGNQLHCGNSLVGARRQGYTKGDLTTRTKGLRWYDKAPERIGFETGCSKSHRVYHFLVGDPGMCSYPDKVIKGLESEAIKKLKRWSKDFTAPYTAEEVESLRDLSRSIDQLWAKQVEQQRSLGRRTNDDLPVFGHEEGRVAFHTNIRQKDRVLAEYYRSEHALNAGPYARLKFAMDYWCALWYWPIDKADLLPTRGEYLMDMSLIIVGTMAGAMGVSELAVVQPRLPGLETEEDMAIQQMQEQLGLEGEVNLDQLCQRFERLALARDIAARQHFFHWELEFADVFAERGGFDLVIGNPPWVKLEWNEKGVLSDEDPRFAVKDLSASQTAQEREAALADGAARAAYLDAYVEMTGQKNFLNATQNYPLLKGQQTNLYRCFLPQAWTFTSKEGNAAFVHPDGILNDSKALRLRRQLDQRLRTHFQFANELKMFAGVDHHTTFSLNVYGDERDHNAFDSIWNLYTPQTIEECYESNGDDPIPRVKTEGGDWETRGNKLRIIHVGDEELKTFAKLLGDDDWKGSRVPAVHAQPLMEVLDCLAGQSRTLHDIEDELSSSVCWDETNSIKKDHTLKKDVHFPESISESVYSGAHLGVANPLYQTTRANYQVNSDYDPVDLEAIPDDYLVRTKYSRDCDRAEYERRQPTTPWGKPFTSYYRIANREYVGCSSERTLQAAILPPGTCWINKVFGFATPCLSRLALLAGYTSSLPLDYFVRAIGKADVNYATTMQYPLVESVYDDEIRCRALLLNCLTKDYADLWKGCYQDSFRGMRWAKTDPRLPVAAFAGLTDTWGWSTPLRRDLPRRQALVELDVLVSMALGLTLNQLITVYQMDFSVLQSYEQTTYYDCNGRVVASSKGMGNAKLKLADFLPHKDEKSGSIEHTFSDDTQPGGPVERTIRYEAPYDTFDRVADYREAWAFFQDKYQHGGGVA